MIKQNTTNSGFFGKIESIIRVIPHIYIIFRMLVRFTNYFEEDFLYLKKIFNNRKVNIIDVGASDGISAQFFLRNLKCKKIFCYEPQKVFFLKLTNLKKRFNNLVLFNYGLAKKNFKMDIFYPFVSFFGFKVFLLTYSFPIKKELEDQIDLDFFIKPGIQKSKILVKKYKIQNDKIDLIKIDTNGSEYEIVETLFRLIKRDKPVLIIENNNISKIFKNLKKLGYKKYYVINDTLKKHTNQNSANIIFK
jgi:FkbM family methyltransferase|tara:strand:+ start:624 stop:1367 length:744 start_codon:yes stop_codon:yes gene_type:complete